MKIIIISLLLFIFAQAENNEFIELNSKEGQFSISFPGKPDETVRPIQTKIGVLNYKHYSLQKDSIQYEFFFTPLMFSDETLKTINDEKLNYFRERFYTSAKKSMLRKAGDRIEILSETRIISNGVPCLDLIAKVDNGRLVKNRLFLTKYFSYSLLTFSDKDNDQVIKKMDKFLNSFRIQI